MAALLCVLAAKGRPSAQNTAALLCVLAGRKKPAFLSTTVALYAFVGSGALAGFVLGVVSAGSAGMAW